jgi:anti-sigma regulatory factor (Ser/Thr protein kinase)
VAGEQVPAQRAPVVPDAASLAHVDLAGTPHSAPLVRIFLREQLRQRVDEDTLHTAELLTTELVTNAVLHARSSIHVDVTRDEHNLLVTVQDDDPIDPTHDGNGQFAHDDLERSGRGMLLVASLADDFGWTRLTDHAGKVMWFALGIPPEATAPGRRPGAARAGG